MNILIGKNGTGKTNILDAINYFFQNMTSSNICSNIFDENNRYSNEVKITLFFDLSKFVKISILNTEDDNIFEKIFPDYSHTTKYHDYYKKIIHLAKKASNNTLALELAQIKNRTITWNYSYEDRLIFKSLFPLFFINSRDLDITKWNQIWNVISDLIKTSNIERTSLESKIRNILSDEATVFSKKIICIESLFEDAKISISKSTSKKFAEALTKLYFAGESFKSNGKSLSFFSAGTNSVNYITLLLLTVSQISQIKLKEPIILLDEPEISLHPSFVDNLSKTIIEHQQDVSFLIATHSSRLIKNLIKNSNTTLLYNIHINNNYSNIQRMKLFSQYSPTSKYRITDDHANAYFSKALLFVEGATELELFSNPYLQTLFPNLHNIDIYQALSDTPLLNIMHPKKTNTKTPYIGLIDMDKVFSYDKDERKLILKKEYFNDINMQKENLQYYNKKSAGYSISNQHKRILSMSQKLKIHYSPLLYSSEDPFLIEYINAIKSYLRNYHYLICQTTIEGTLITQENYEFTLNYLKSKKPQILYEEFLSYLSSLDLNDQVNVLRLVFNGKSDLLFSYNQLARANPSFDKDILSKMMIGKKTIGWVSEFIDLFFQEQLSSNTTITPKQFINYLKKDNNKNSVLTNFSIKFPELYHIITQICNIL